jgi:hypothetical protein
MLNFITGFIVGGIICFLVGRKHPAVADAVAKIANQGKDAALKAAEDIKAKVG